MYAITTQICGNFWGTQYFIERMTSIIWRVSNMAWLDLRQVYVSAA